MHWPQSPWAQGSPRAANPTRRSVRHARCARTGCTRTARPLVGPNRIRRPVPRMPSGRSSSRRRRRRSSTAFGGRSRGRRPRPLPGRLAQLHARPPLADIASEARPGCTPTARGPPVARRAQRPTPRNGVTRAPPGTRAPVARAFQSAVRGPQAAFAASKRSPPPQCGRTGHL